MPSCVDYYDHSPLSLENPAVSEILVCVRQLVGVLQARGRASTVIGKPKENAVVVVKQPIWPFQKVLDNIATIAERMRDKILSKDPRQSMEFAFIASILRIASDNAVRFDLNQNGFNMTCLYLFGQMCFAFNVARGVVQDSDLKSFSAGISRGFFKYNTDNLEIYPSGPYVDVHARGMLSALGKWLYKEKLSDVRVIEDPGRVLMRQVADALVIRPTEFRSECMDSGYEALYLESEKGDGNAYSDNDDFEFDDEGEISPSANGNSSDDDGYPTVRTKNFKINPEGLQPSVVSFKNALKGIELDINKSLEMGWAGSSFRDDVVEFGHRVLCESILAFCSIACSTITLDGKRKSSENMIPRYEKSYISGAGTKYCRLLDEMRLTTRAAALMFSSVPFNSESEVALKLKTIFQAISSGLDGFKATLRESILPRAINKLMITVLINLGRSLTNVQASFSVFRDKRNEHETLMLKVVARLLQAGQ